MTPLPSSLRIGYRDYAVQSWPHREANAMAADGLCDNATATIRVSDERTGLDMAETLLHEVLHAVWHTSDIHHEDGEERIVTRMASALMQVWRDNPEFRRLMDDVADVVPVRGSWREAMVDRLDELVNAVPPVGTAISTEIPKWWRNSSGGPEAFGEKPVAEEWMAGTSSRRRISALSSLRRKQPCPI